MNGLLHCPLNQLAQFIMYGHACMLCHHTSTPDVDW